MMNVLFALSRLTAFVSRMIVRPTLSASLQPPRGSTNAEAKRRWTLVKDWAAFRRENGLSKQALAKLINLRVIQVRCYEVVPLNSGCDSSAVTLLVSADVLIFSADEDPDGDLQLQFEAISKLASEEKQVIKAAAGRNNPSNPKLTVVLRWLILHAIKLSA